MLTFTIVLGIILLICVAGAGHVGGGGGFSVMCGVFLIVVGLRLYEEVLQLDCEASLPRDQTCSIIAVPPPQVEAVKKLLEEPK